ncbi:MAG: hypothetical protein ACSHYB_05255 [Roseibacillus sp.]
MPIPPSSPEHALRVPQKLSSILSNARYAHHPFRRGQLQEFVQIVPELTSLPEPSFSSALRQIEHLVQEHGNTCSGCYGNGLAYLVQLIWSRPHEAHYWPHYLELWETYVHRRSSGQEERQARLERMDQLFSDAESQSHSSRNEPSLISL